MGPLQSDGDDSDSPRRQGRGRRVLNEFTDDESPSSGQSVFTAQSLNRAGLSIRPRSIWLGDSQQQIRQYKGQGGQLIRPPGHRENSHGGVAQFSSQPRSRY